MLAGPLHPEIAWPALGIGVLAAGAAATRLGRIRPSVWAAVGALVALVVTQHPPGAASVGLALLTLVGFLPDGFRPRGVAGALLGVILGVGLALLSVGLPAEIASWDTALWATIALVAALTAAVGQSFGQATTLALLSMSVAGIWATVPDTEAPLAVGAALAPVLVVAIAARRETHRRDDLIRWTGVIAASTWAALVGGQARPGAAAAAIASYGVLVTAGLVFGVTSVVMHWRLVRRRSTTVAYVDRAHVSTRILLAGQALTVWAAARWGGPRVTLADARGAIILASIVAVSTAVAALARDLIAGEAVDRERPE